MDSDTSMAMDMTPPSHEGVPAIASESPVSAAPSAATAAFPSASVAASSSPSPSRKGKQRTSEERKAEADRWFHWTETCRLLPTKAQHRRLERALDVTRELYNAALEERFTKLSRWHQTAKFKPEFQPTVDPATGRKVYPPNPYFPSAFDGHKDLTTLRDPALGMAIADYPVALGRGVLNRAAAAFQAFYARKSNGQKGGRPRFKGKTRWRTLEFSALDGVRAVWNPRAVREAKAEMQAQRKAEQVERDRAHREAQKAARAAGLPPPPRPPKAPRVPVDTAPPPLVTIPLGTHLLVFPPVGALRLRTHRGIPAGSEPCAVKLVRKAGGQWEAHIGFKALKAAADTKVLDAHVTNPEQGHLDGASPEEIVIPGTVATLETAADPTLGIDWNIGSLAVCSDGFTLPNTRLGTKARKARRRQERLVARSKKGSKTRAKKVQRLAVLRGREADARRTERHTGAKRLVDHAVAHGHRAIAVEDIDVAGLMAKRTKVDADAAVGYFSAVTEPQPASQVTATLPWETAAGQRALKRELADASIGVLKSYTLAKAARAGLGVVLVPAHGTTQTCARCATTSPTKLTLSDRIFSCACGWTADRDVNASLVVLRRGRKRADPRPTPQAPWAPPVGHPGLESVGKVLVVGQGAKGQGPQSQSPTHTTATAYKTSTTSRKGLGP
jgi:transposase